MTAPEVDQVFGVLDTTWPPARFHDAGALRLREGKGGGQRVSAATANGRLSRDDLRDGEARMRDLGQRPLFMIRPGEDALDSMLDAEGYEIVDPVTIYAAPTADIGESQTAANAVESWPPLAIQREIWMAGGIGEARLAVMTRASCPRTTILGRANNRPAATVYVGASGDVAMLHALETRLEARRAGAGRRLVKAAGNWARRNGATWLTLAVTRANEPANALYRSTGMIALASYHYRRAPEAAS